MDQYGRLSIRFHVLNIRQTNYGVNGLLWKRGKHSHNGYIKRPIGYMS